MAEGYSSNVPAPLEDKLAIATRLTPKGSNLSTVTRQQLMKLMEAGIQGPRLRKVLQTIETRDQGSANAVIYATRAILNSYSSEKLQIVGTNVVQFESFINDIEQVIELRKEFQDQGYTLSYEDGITLHHELGDRVLGLLDRVNEYIDTITQSPRYSDPYVKSYNPGKIMIDLVKLSKETGNDPESLLEEMMKASDQREPEIKDIESFLKYDNRKGL